MDLLPEHSLQGAASVVRTSALQMLEEHGRGVVLVSDARVDATLARLLQAMLLPSPDRSDDLFQADRPLGAFGACISLAHRLGLIETLVELALDTLRCVHNAFAHSSESASSGFLPMPSAWPSHTRTSKLIRSGRPWNQCPRRPAMSGSYPLIQPCGTTSC